jgi:hypothetical protein
MRSYILGMITSIIIFASLGVNKSNLSPAPTKEWVIAPRFLTLQEGISKEEAREWLENEYLFLYREFPGFNAMVGEPISSAGWGTTNNNEKEKDFVMIYFFDSKESLDHYFPNGEYSNEIKEGIKKHQPTFDKLFGKYFLEGKYQYEDYLMFASSK